MARFAPQALAISFALLSFLFSALASPVLPVATPLTGRSPTRVARQTAEPTFPSDIASCPICEQNYANINSCAQAAPVLQNFTMIIFNPGAFIDVIECACTDTFQSAYPQCVDCFIKTNQTSFLDADSEDLPSVVSGMRSICALESTLLGNVSNTDGESPSSTTAAASATSTTSGASQHVSPLHAIVAALAASIVAVLL